MGDGDKNEQYNNMLLCQPGDQVAGMPDIISADSEGVKLNEASANDNLQTDGSAFD